MTSTGLTRRIAIGGLAAAGIGAAGLLSAPALPAAAPKASRPPRLRKGDRLGLVAPAGFVGDRFGVEEIMDTVRAMGLEPVAAPNLLSREGYLAGADAQRADGINTMLADDSIRALMAVRGGYGAARLLPRIDFAAIARKPKLFCGFSDNTALHLALSARAGVISIHGPNASASWPPAAWEAFERLAFEGTMPTYAAETYAGPNLGGRGSGLRTFRGGKARGRLLGGNLSVLCSLAGTPYLPDFSGAILFLEDTNEAEYRIDRMLAQLSLAGILGKVAGVVFGQCTRCSNPGEPYANFTIYEVMDHHFGALKVPAFQGLSIGHIAAQISLPVGAMAEIDADAGTLAMLEPAVE